MVQSPSWEANWFAASQEIPRISRNPKVHYRTRKRPPPVPILGQPNPIHILTSHLLEIRPNIIHPSTPMSPQWFLSFRFPHQDPIHPSLLTHTRHMPSPSLFRGIVWWYRLHSLAQNPFEFRIFVRTVINASIPKHEFELNLTKWASTRFHNDFNVFEKKTPEFSYFCDTNLTKYQWYE